VDLQERGTTRGVEGIDPLQCTIRASVDTNARARLTRRINGGPLFRLGTRTALTARDSLLADCPQPPHSVGPH